MDTGSDIKLHLPHPSAHGAGAASPSATLTRLNHVDNEGKRILYEHNANLRCVDNARACRHPHIIHTLEEKLKIDRRYTGEKRKQVEGNIEFHDCMWVKAFDITNC